MPHSDKNPIRFRMPVWIFAGAFALLFAMLCATTVLSFSAYRLRLVEAENAGLEKISADQEQQLSELEQLSDEVTAKLYDIGQSENELRAKVGLDPIDIGVGSPYAVELPDTAARASRASVGDSALTARLGYQHDRLLALNNGISSAYNSYSLLQDEVDDRLDYLAALPSAWPLENSVISSYFGYRIDPFLANGDIEYHSGLDLLSPEGYGALITAAGDGTVTLAGDFGTAGIMVEIDHGYGYCSLYAHCSELLVSVGDVVSRGDPIARVGNTGRSTGAHLHFSVIYEGENIDPLEILTPAETE